HRDVAEEVAAEDEQPDPGDSADDVVGDEACIRHAADAGDEGCEGTNDRHEARDDDRLAAVLFVELVRALEILAFQKSDVLLKDARADQMPNPVVDGVAADGGDTEQRED